MSDEWERPSAATLKEFAGQLAAFRDSLPPEQQRLLDALVIAALRPDWWDEVQPYWAQIAAELA
jgi:hypothetical protein